MRGRLALAEKGKQMCPKSLGIIPIGFALLLSTACAMRGPTRGPREAATVVSTTAGTGEYATIAGITIDEARRPVIGCSISFSCTDQKNNRGAATDIDGKFILQGLSPGIYTITFEAPGYKTTKTTDVLVERGSSLRVEAVLPTGQEDFGCGNLRPPINQKDTSVGVVIYNDDNGFPRVETK